VKQQLAKDKRLFGFVSKEGRAAELERAGNKIDVAKNKEISTGAAQAEEVYNKLSGYAGPVANALESSAQRLANGDNPNVVKQEAYRDIRAEISKTLGAVEGARPEGSQEVAGRGTDQAQPEADHPVAPTKTPIDLLRPEKPAPPFFSQAERIAEAKLPNSMLGLAALRTLENNGVKPDEIKWMGLDDFLKGRGKVSKQEVLDFIRQNQVQVNEVENAGR
jgi:hypothetical protein